MGWIEVSLLVRWLLGWPLRLRMPALPAAATGAGPPRQRPSLLIPARNEAATLPHLLVALARQSLPPLEVIVIDDHSEDRTATIAVETEPDFLASLVVAHRRWGGLISVQPYHRTERPYELLSLLFNLVGLMAVPLGPGCGVAFGPAMITSRTDYLRSGGHAAVADKVVEDWFLAHAYEAAGLPVSAWIGHGQIAYRMYPGGLADMVSGFDKNFATAAGEVRWPWMLAVLLWLSGLFWAAWCLPAALLGLPLVGDPGLLPNLLLYAAFALQLLVITRPVGRFGWISLVFPLPVLFFLGVFLLAILNLERGQVVWKGRRVATR